MYTKYNCVQNNVYKHIVVVVISNTNATIITAYYIDTIATHVIDMDSNHVCILSRQTFMQQCKTKKIICMYKCLLSKTKQDLFTDC